MRNKPTIDIPVNVDTKKAKKQLSKFKKDAKGAGKEFENAFAGTKLGKLTGQVKKLGTVIGGTAGAIAGSAVAVGALAFSYKKLADQIAGTADATGKSAEKMGVTIGMYQKLASMAEHGGTNIGVMESAMKKLLNKMTQVDQGTKLAIEGFEGIGISVMDSNGAMRDQSVVFRETLIALSKMENRTQRNAKAQELLGGSAKELIPTLNDGADAINRAFGDEKAVAITQELANAAKGYNDSMKDLTNAGIKGFMSNLTPFMTMMEELAASFNPEDIERWGSNVSGVFNLILRAGAVFLSGFNAIEMGFEALMDSMVIVGLAAAGAVEIGWTNSIGFLEQLMDGFVSGSLAIAGTVAGIFNKELGDELKEASKFANDESAKRINERKAQTESTIKHYRTSIDMAKEEAMVNIENGLARGESTSNFILGVKKATVAIEELNDATKATTVGGKKGGKKEDKKGEETQDGGKKEDNIEEETPDTTKAIASYKSFQDAMRFIQEGALSSRLLNTNDHYDEMQVLTDASLAKGLITQAQYKVASATLTQERLDALSEVREESATAVEEPMNIFESIFGTQEQMDEQSKAIMDSVVGTISNVASSVMNIMNEMASFRNTKNEEEIKSLNKKNDKNAKGLNVSNKRKKQIEGKHDKEIEAIKKKQFKDNKKNQIANILVSSSVNAMMTLASAMGQLGPIAGAIVGGIGAAVVTAGAAIAIANVNAQTFADGGVVGGFNGATSGPDNRNVIARDGEMYLNARQQKNTFDMLNSGMNKMSGNETIPANITLNNTFNGPVNEDIIPELERVNSEFLSNLENGLEDLKTYGRLPSLA
jgi:hypothetical protein